LPLPAATSAEPFFAGALFVAGLVAATLAGVVSFAGFVPVETPDPTFSLATALLVGPVLVAGALLLLAGLLATAIFFGAVVMGAKFGEADPGLALETAALVAGGDLSSIRISGIGRGVATAEVFGAFAFEAAVDPRGRFGMDEAETIGAKCPSAGSSFAACADAVVIVVEPALADGGDCEATGATGRGLALTIGASWPAGGVGPSTPRSLAIRRLLTPTGGVPAVAP